MPSSVFPELNLRTTAVNKCRLVKMVCIQSKGSQLLPERSLHSLCFRRLEESRREGKGSPSPAPTGWTLFLRD